MSANPDDLLNKLKSMGVQFGANHLAPKPTDQPQEQPSRHAYAIEAVVRGFDLPTDYGLAFICEQDFPDDYRHGMIPLCVDTDPQVLAAWGAVPRLSDPRIENVVFLDTETSGLAGGTGTYIFLVGIGYRTAQGFHLVQFFMREPGQEAALLSALLQWLSPFNVVVTFNGKTFDLPLLHSRLTINGLQNQVAACDHLDLLMVARRLWRDRLPSRALGSLEREIARFKRTGEEVPGWQVPQLYFNYLHTGDARPLAGVFYHNAMDILSLASLYHHIAALLKEPLRFAEDSGLDLAAIARLYEELGWLEQAAVLYENSIEHDLPENFFFKTIDRYATMRRKQGEWQKAVTLWQKAAEHGQWTACVELAKYYEHQARDYVQALHWTHQAVALLDRHFTYESTRRPVELELRQRVARLMRKVSV